MKLNSKYINRINKIHNSVYIQEYGEDKLWDKINDASLLDNVEFEEGKDGFDLIKLRLTNPTEYEFKDFDLTLVLYDVATENMDVVEEIHAEVGDWKPGEDTIVYYQRTTKKVEHEAPILYFY